MYGPRFWLLSRRFCSLQPQLRDWLEQSLAMRSTATKAFGVRKAIPWLNVSQNQHNKLQVIATRGDTNYLKLGAV